MLSRTLIAWTERVICSLLAVRENDGNDSEKDERSEKDVDGSSCKVKESKRPGLLQNFNLTNIISVTQLLTNLTKLIGQLLVIKRLINLLCSLAVLSYS
jgi:hypothetical protein